MIQGVVRVDSLDRNTGVEGDDLNTFTAGINYFLTKDGYSRWQLNYERDRDDSSHTTNNLILAQFQAGF